LLRANDFCRLAHIYIELKKEFKQVKALTKREQKSIADFILDGVNWAKIFKKNEEKVSNLAEEAMDECKVGKTKPLDF
jgi:hypothetical protein